MKNSLVRPVLIWSIRLYQYTLSPDHGMLGVFFPLFGCRFSPTCSEYTKQCIGAYGVKRGIAIGIKQFVRCHPFLNSKLKVKSVKQ